MKENLAASGIDPGKVTAVIPFPGIGHVRAAKEGFEWIPEPWAST